MFRRRVLGTISSLYKQKEYKSGQLQETLDSIKQHRQNNIEPDLELFQTARNLRREIKAINLQLSKQFAIKTKIDK